MHLAPDANRADALAIAARSFAEGRFHEVKALCLAELEREPDAADDPAVLRQLAMAHLLAHEFGPAREILERVAPKLPDDGKLWLALAESVWATRSATDALPHFRSAKRLLPDDFGVRERFGLALLMAGDAEAAKAELEAAVELEPASVAALTHLGLAQSLTGAVERAIPLFEAALEIDPGSVDTLFQLGSALRAGGHSARAIDVFRNAVERSPRSALLRVALGDALKDAGDPLLAVRQFLVAVRVQPGWSVAWTALADGLDRLGDCLGSVSAYRTALLLDPTQSQVHALLGNVLHKIGEIDLCHRQYRQSMQDAPWTGTVPKIRPQITVAVLAAPGSANTPTRFILDPAALSVHIFYVLPGSDAEARQLSSSVDIVFNAISDADSASSGFGDLNRLAALIDQPILNDPRVIEATRRDRAPSLLADIEGCVVPRAIRCTAPAFAQAAEFAEAVGYPVLVRPIGSHGGEGLVKIDDEAALALTLAEYDDVYVSRFHDCRAADGWYRKYRLIVVDGVVLPYHLAIHDHWLVHYFRSPTVEMDVFRDEETMFLDDPAHMLGTTAYAALCRIAERVKLDFFGIDCTVDAAGNLLVFECNATMLVRDDGVVDMARPKQIAAKRIRDAMTAMIERRVTG